MSHRTSPVSHPHGPPRAYRSLEELGARAIVHAQERLLTACEAIAMIGGIATRWQKPYSPRLSVSRAHVVDGSAGPGEQAAHVLPGQLLIDGRKPWALARGDRQIAAWIARFEVTAALPTPFNVADSQAEGAGLKAAFLHGCENAWTRVAAGERDLTATFAEFLADATRAFERAELSKAEKSGAARSTHASDERLVESIILRMYKAHGVTAEEANRRFPLSRFVD